MKAKWQKIKATPRANPPGRYVHVSTPRAHVPRSKRLELGVVTGLSLPKNGKAKIGKSGRRQVKAIRRALREAALAAPPQE